MEFMMFNDVRAVWVQGEIVALLARVMPHVYVCAYSSTLFTRMDGWIHMCEYANISEYA